MISFASCSRKILEITQSPTTWRLIYYDHPGWRIRKPAQPPTSRDYDHYDDEDENGIDNENENEDEDDENDRSMIDWRRIVKEREILERRWRRGAPRFDTREPIRVSRLAIYCVFFLEDIIITGGKDHAISFWQWNPRNSDLRNLSRFPKAHDGSVLCMAVDAEWRHKTGLMITGGSDAMIKVWDLDNALMEWDDQKSKPKQIHVLAGHTAGVLDLALCERKFYSW